MPSSSDFTGAAHRRCQRVTGTPRSRARSSGRTGAGSGRAGGRNAWPLAVPVTNAERQKRTPLACADQPTIPWNFLSGWRRIRADSFVERARGGDACPTRDAQPASRRG